MIESVKIENPEKSPVKYISSLPNFIGREIKFKAGNNIIIGPNGSGKSTLLKLIEKYHLISDFDSDVKNLNHSGLFDFNGKFLDGVKVYGDYTLNMFKFSRGADLIENDLWAKNIGNFIKTFNQKNSSTGESLMFDISQFFEKIFNSKVNLKFCIDELEKIKENGNDVWKKNVRALLDYYDECRVRKEKQFTLLFDEPDRNLDIRNVNEILGVLKTVRPDTQLICVIHNPLVIYKLSKNKDINFIEMEDGYLNLVKNSIDALIK